mmetsp:Transcript_41227/g.41858  ORF Transcript_41227/g.41858 Transcript_41227/m.41858 type:complete len:321 (-) Transcript_41227:11-973(-)
MLAWNGKTKKTLRSNNVQLRGPEQKKMGRPFNWVTGEQKKNVTTPCELDSDSSHWKDEIETVPPPEKEQLDKEEKQILLDDGDRHVAIAYFFVHKHKGLQNLKDGKFVEKWNRRGGIIGKIRKDLGKKINSGMVIKNTLLEILLYYTNETKFDPKQMEIRDGKRLPTFQLASIKSQIIDDAVESGLSVNKSLYLVNEHLAEEGRDLVSLSWSRAMVLWMTQLMVRMGLIDMQKKVNGLVEKRWDRDALDHLALDQIGWWDETYQKCLIGGIRKGRDFCLQFKRNEKGPMLLLIWHPLIIQAALLYLFQIIEQKQIKKFVV